MSMSDQPYLTLIDHETSGNRCDVTPLFADYGAFSALIDDLAALVEPLALRCHVGFIPIRKGGKLLVDVDSAECVDYTGQRKTLELRRDALKPGMRVLLVDEWIETGAQVRAALALIEGRGGVIAGIASLHIDENEQTEPLRARYGCVQVAPEL